MNHDQFEQIARGTGSIAALDQSGGSTPGALARYGISHEGYSDDEMFELMHEMRTRIVTVQGASSSSDASVVERSSR